MSKSESESEREGGREEGREGGRKGGREGGRENGYLLFLSGVVIFSCFFGVVIVNTLNSSPTETCLSVSHECNNLQKLYEV